jgi:prevent-host-death family protein
MKVVSLSDLKRHLSLTIRLVRNGESLVILDRGRPVGRFAPLSAVEDWENILDALARTRDVRRPERPLPDSFFGRDRKWSQK